MYKNDLPVGPTLYGSLCCWQGWLAVAEKGTRPSVLGNKVMWADCIRVALNAKADGPSKLIGIIKNII